MDKDNVIYGLERIRDWGKFGQEHHWLMPDGIDKIVDYADRALDYVYASEQVRYGHWVDVPDKEKNWKCSECGAMLGLECGYIKYCPNCGAKMAEPVWAACGCGQAFSP